MGSVGLSALLFAASQAPLGLWWLAPFALIPWLATLPASPARGALSGLGLGTAGAALGSLWIRDGLVALGAGPAFASLGVLVASAGIVGLPWALLGAASAAARRVGPLGGIASFAAAVFVVETARAHVELAIPWLLLGHSQWQAHGVAQLAVIGGVPLVSALLGALNAAGAAVVRSGAPPSRRRAALALGALAGAYGAVLGLGLPWVEAVRGEPEPAALDLLVVQPDIPAQERWSARVQRTHLARVERQTRVALRRTKALPDLVLWPETLLTQPLDRNAPLRRALLAAVGKIGVPVVLGAARSATSGDPQRYRNSALWIDPEAGLVASFDKTHAVPVVESGRAFAGRGVVESLLGLAFERERAEEGTENRPLRGPVELAVALCFESVFPNLLAARRTPETSALVNLANDSWFASETPGLQQVAFASFRSVEQRLWLVRVAHGGVSAVVDPYGRLVRRLPFGEQSTLRASVHREGPPSLVERLGLLALLAAGGAGGLALSLPLARRFLP